MFLDGQTFSPHKTELLPAIEHPSLPQYVTETNIVLIPTKPEPATLLELSSEYETYDKIEEFGRSAWNNIREYSGVVSEDWRSSDAKMAFLSVWAGYGIVKFAGRFKLPPAIVGFASIEVMDATQDTLIVTTPATVATATIATIGWSRLATGAMNSTVDNNPNLYRKHGDVAPRINEAYGDTLPGLRSCTSEEISRNKKLPLTKRARKGISTHAARGVKTSGTLTAYITAAGREGQTTEERRRLAWASSIDAGLFAGSLYGFLTIAANASDDHPEISEYIRNGVRNPIVWAAIGGLITGGTFIKNRWHRHKNKIEPATQTLSSVVQSSH